MKAYPWCLQELHPPAVRVGAAGCDFGATTISSGHTTTTASSCTGNKRLIIRRVTTLVFTGKGHAVFLAPFPKFPPYRHLFRQKLVNSCSRNSTSIYSTNDADYLEEGGKEQIDLEPLNNFDSNIGEDVEYRGFGDGNLDLETFSETWSDEKDGIGIQVTKLGKRLRRIESRIRINASLSTIWDVLTDYERLADFIPGLAISRLLEKGDNFARLYQIGQQNLALGLKFNAKAVLDCYEKDLEILSFGKRRDIEFKMVEGDFETFEGKWSIEQYDAGSSEASQPFETLEGQEFYTILSYVVELVPKLWLPVRLVEGRLCSEIKTNLTCIRQEAQMRTSSCS